MLYTRAVAMVFTAALLNPVFADNSHYALPSLGDQESARWQSVDSSMQRNEYGQAVRHNKRIVTRAARNYLEGELVSMGVSKQAVGVAGATVGFLVDGGKFNLNDSKTISLEVKDVVDNDRAMYLNYKLSW